MAVLVALLAVMPAVRILKQAPRWRIRQERWLRSRSACMERRLSLRQASDPASADIRITGGGAPGVGASGMSGAGSADGGAQRAGGRVAASKAHCSACIIPCSVGHPRGSPRWAPAKIGSTQIGVAEHRRGRR